MQLTLSYGFYYFRPLPAVTSHTAAIWNQYNQFDLFYLCAGMKDLNSRLHRLCCSIWCNAIAQEKPKSSVRVDTRSFKSKPPWLRIMTESLEDNCGFHHPSLRSPFAVTPQDSTTSPYKLVDQMKCCARYFYPQPPRKSNSLVFQQRQHPMFPCKRNNSQLKF